MKYAVIMVALSVSFLVVKCSSYKAVSYDYPEDITEAGKKDFVVNFEKGRVLYKITCANCHNSVVDGKTYIPDFSLPQLMDYEIRVQYPAHSEDLKESNMTPLELDLIVDFLRYKKKNPPDVKVPFVPIASK